ncbi:unnamed protein product [Paramecium sonneborni]|uniref:Uncharacterized protein n=1 Tax=Paramecium sonneborni TaxID=65129 RepID=A0A8S1PTE0_9CILI|nr:unnamed protein product [Paramecium sonneborni]
MASQIVFKEKDYEFIYKTRAIQLQQTTDNPLKLDRPKVTIQRGRKGNVQIRTKGNFIDPLSRAANQKAQQTNPLSRPQTVDPLARPIGQPTSKIEQQQAQVQAKSVEPNKIQQQQQQQQDGKLEIDAEEKQLKATGEFSIYWQEIRDDFQNIFQIKTYDLEQPVPNPFGSNVQTMNQFDGQAKAAYSGDNKIEYQTQAPRQGTSKQILQKTYIQKVLDIRRDLKRQWINGDKVASLQLAIQSCKLLIDNDKPLFAPVKYVYIIDILETFGKFVIERLLKLSYPQYTDQKIAEISLQSVVGSNISETASEIGRNWINKIGSIRELLPRLYIESTLLKVYYFIDQNQIKPIFQRLIKQVRAIGDYINALYFALYLFRIGAELFSGEKDYLISTLKDFFIYMNQKSKFGKFEVQGDQYLRLFEPYLIQTFRQYSQNCTEREFKDIFEHFRQSTQNHFVLKKMIEQFQAVHISTLALELFSIMQAYPVENKYQLYACFLPKIAKGLTNVAAGSEICQYVLQDILQIKSFSLFLEILASLIELIFRSFQGYQKNQFFFQILQRFNDLFSMVEKDQVNTNQSRDTFIKLHQFIIKIFQDSQDISEILQIDTFITCIQFFPEDMKKLVCNDLLSMIINRDQKEKITDPMAVHSIVKLTTNLNNKKTITKDESKNLAKIINQLLQKIDFGKDLEQSLNLYAEMRGQFGNISGLSEILIDRALDLIFRGKRLSKGKNQKKIISFYQACIAYSFITIPTIDNPISKLRKYLQVAQVGLSLNLLSQSEAVIKTAIETLLELPDTHNGRPIDEVALPYILDLISFIILVPDDPSAGYLNIFQGLLKAIEQFKWNQKNGGIYSIVVYVNCIQYLCAQVQERLPYHFENVKSNDALFNKDTQFSMTVLELVQQLYIKLGEQTTGILKLNITDSIENGLIVKQMLSCLNRLLLLLKFNKEAQTTFTIFIDLIYKKINDLNRDRTGKVQLTLLKPYFLITFLNIEKSTTFNFEEKRNQMISILEAARN